MTSCRVCGSRMQSAGWWAGWLAGGGMLGGCQDGRQASWLVGWPLSPWNVVSSLQLQEAGTVMSKHSHLICKMDADVEHFSGTL